MSGTTRSNRRAVWAGILCGAVLVGVGLVLDANGVKFSTAVIPALITAAIVVGVILLVRRRS